MRTRRLITTRTAFLLWLAATALAVAAPSATADWPSYGKDLANTRDGGTDGPSPARAAALTKAWSFQSSNGDFTGTPVVSSGTVIAGSGGGTVFALDAATGAVRWSHDFNEPINGSAAIANGIVYIPLATPSSPKLASLALADGTVRWVRQLDTQKDADVFGSSAVWSGTVLIGTAALIGWMVSGARASHSRPRLEHHHRAAESSRRHPRLDRLRRHPHLRAEHARRRDLGARPRRLDRVAVGRLRSDPLRPGGGREWCRLRQRHG